MPTKAELNNLKPESRNDERSFNLSELNLLELSTQLETSLKKPVSNWLFFKHRENRKLELDRQRVQNLIAIIADLRLTQEQLINYKADTIFSDKMVEALITGKQWQLQVNLENYKNEVQKLKDDMATRQEQIRKLELENLLLEARARSDNAKADIIEKFAKQIDFTNMPSILYDRVIQALMGAEPVDTDLQEKMKVITIREAEAKTVQIESQADLSKATAKKAVKEIESD